MDQLRPDRHRAVGDAVEVTDDDVGLQTELEQSVRASIDADQDGPVLLDVRAQRRQVVLVIVPAHDNQCVTPVEVGPQRRECHRIEGERRLLLHVLERVAGEAAELVPDAFTRLLHAPLDLFDGQQLARRELLATAPERSVDDLDRLSFLQDLQHLGPDGVEKRNPGANDADRSAVGVTARDRLGSVHQRGDTPSYEALGGDAVEVAVVDHGDVALLEATHQILGATVDACRSTYTRLSGPLLLHRERAPDRTDSAASRSSAACRRA